MSTAQQEGGRRLKAARAAVRLSLRELSERTGKVLSESRISNYEQGLRRMTPQIALMLAKILGVKATYLLCIDDGSGTVDEKEEELTPDETRLLKSFRAMNEKDRERALIHLEVMAIPHRKGVSDAKVEKHLPIAPRIPKFGRGRTRAKARTKG